MSNTLRCSVVGLGRIGWQFHVPQIVQREGFVLQAVVDPDESRLKEAQEQHGVKIAVRDILELPLSEIDLAVITSPTKFHCSQVIFFLEHGIDVFCDKPMALSLAESRKMADAAKKHHRKLMVYQPHRVTSEALTSQMILKSGKLGKPFLLARNCDCFSRRNDWQAIAKNGGGMLFNYGAHFIDQMLFLGQDRCAKAKCEIRTVVSRGDADDMVKTLITGESGCLYEVSINMASAIDLPPLVLYGEKGTAVELPGNKWKIRYCESMPELVLDQNLSAAGRRYPSENLPWIEEIIDGIPEHYGDFYIYVHDYFAKGKTPFVPVSETLEVMRTIELCLADAQSEKEAVGK